MGLCLCGECACGACLCGVCVCRTTCACRTTCKCRLGAWACGSGACGWRPDVTAVCCCQPPCVALAIVMRQTRIGTTDWHSLAPWRLRLPPGRLAKSRTGARRYTSGHASRSAQDPKQAVGFILGSRQNRRTTVLAESQSRRGVNQWPRKSASTESIDGSCPVCRALVFDPTCSFLALGLRPDCSRCGVPLATPCGRVSCW